MDRLAVLRVAASISSRAGEGGENKYEISDANILPSPAKLPILQLPHEL